MTCIMRAPALCEDVADLIRERILSHVLRSGAYLDERALAQELGVSRTPVREALRILHHEGLLEAKARKGMYVPELTASQRQQALLMRDALQMVSKASGKTPFLSKLMTLVEQQIRLTAMQPSSNEQLLRKPL